MFVVFVGRLEFCVFSVIFAIMSLPLTAEQLDQLQPDTKDILLQYFNDQNTRLDDIRGKYERLRVDSGMSHNFGIT